MKEAVFLQYLTEFLTQDKFGDIVKDYKFKKSSDTIKLNVTFDLTKLVDPSPIIKDKTVKLSDSKVVEEVKELVGEIDERDATSKEEEISVADAILGPEEPKEEQPNIIEAMEIAETVKEDLKKDPLRNTKIGDIFTEKKPEVPKQDSVVPISQMPTITADEEGNVIIGGKPTKVTTTKEEPKNVTTPILSNGRSLYKDHYFSDEEVMYLNAYLNNEITGGEGAELLGLKKSSDFYNLVQRYKRSKNITGAKTKRTSKRTVPSPNMRFGQKMTEDDLKLAYEKVKNGECKLIDMARQFGVASSTMTIRMHKYIENNNLKPLYPTTTNKVPLSQIDDEEEFAALPGRRNPALDTIDYEYVYRQIKMGDTMAALAKDYGVPENSLTKRFKKYCDSIGVDFHVSAIRTPLRSVAKVVPTTKEKVTVPAGTSDGWQIASDNKFHLVDKKGNVVE